MVVDDDEDTRAVVCSIAERAGILAVAAGDSDDAIAMIRSIQIDVRIVQLRVPGQLDGVGLVQLVRQRTPDLPVIYISRFPHAGNLDVALGAPVLHKAALRHELENVLARARLSISA